MKLLFSFCSSVRFLRQTVLLSLLLGGFVNEMSAQKRLDNRIANKKTPQTKTFSLPSIGLVTATPSVIEGNEVQFELRVGDSLAVNELNAISLHINWDSDGVEYVNASAQAGDFLGEGALFFAQKRADERTLDLSTGSVSGSGVNGNGLLATLKFRAIDKGNVRFTVSDIKAEKKDGSTIGLEPFVSMLEISAQPLTKIRFKVNGSLFPDTLQSYHQVQLRGSVTSGFSDPEISTGSGSDFFLTNVGGDYWEGDLAAQSGAELSFKFWVGVDSLTPLRNKSDTYDLQGIEAGAERFLVVPATDTVVTIWLGNTANQSPIPPREDVIAVRFRVNIGAWVKTGQFVPATDTISVRGDTAPLQWTATTGVKLLPESPPNGDNYFYSATAYFNKSAFAGKAPQYKFYANQWETDVVGNGVTNNRQFTLNSDTTLQWSFFNLERPSSEPIVSRTVTFSVNTGALQRAGLFNPDIDRITIRGTSFLGFWSQEALETNAMTFDAASNAHKKTFQISLTENQTVEYKYFILYDQSRLNPASPNYLPAYAAKPGNFPFEQPFNEYALDPNRRYINNGPETQVLPLAYFSGFSPSSIVDNSSAPENVALTFRVDMSAAVNAGNLPVGGRVYFQWRSPFQTELQDFALSGPESGFLAQPVEMTRVGASNVYERVVTMKLPFINEFSYAIVHQDLAGSGLHNASSLHVQYLPPTEVGSSFQVERVGTVYSTMYPGVHVFPTVVYKEGVPDLQQTKIDYENYPFVSSFAQTGTVGGEVTLSGGRFGTTVGTVVFRRSGTSEEISAEVIDWTASSIKVRVPALTAGLVYGLEVRLPNQYRVRTAEQFTLFSSTPSLSATASFVPFVSAAGQASSAQSFTVSGTNLRSNVGISPPAGYEVSAAATASEEAYSQSAITIEPASGIISNRLIWIRMSSGLSEGIYTGNLQITSQDAIPTVIGVTGESHYPTLLTSVGSLGSFTALTTLASSAQSYQVSATYLIDNVVLTLSGTHASAFEISESAFTGFVSTLSLSGTNGTLNPKDIFVRLKAGQSAGSKSASLVHSSSGAQSKTVVLDGVVSVPLAVASEVNPKATEPDNFVVISGSNFVNTGLTVYFSRQGTNLLAAITNFTVSALTVRVPNGVIRGEKYTLTMSSNGSPVGPAADGAMDVYILNTEPVVTPAAPIPVANIQTVPAEELQKKYRLVSIPGRGIAPGVVGLTTIDPTNWRMFRDDGNPDLLEFVSTTTAAGLGEGVWLLSRTAVNAGSLSSNLAVSDNKAAVRVRGGSWNIIANPFADPVDWSAVQAANGLSTSVVLRPFNEGFSGSSSQLIPFEAYYVNIPAGYSYLFIPKPGAAKKTAPKARVLPEWTIDVKLKTPYNNDVDSRIGVASGATVGRDDFELPKPPLVFDLAYLYFDRPEWDAHFPRYSEDFRPSINGGEVWNFNVRNPRGGKATIDLGSLKEIPQNLSVRLVHRKAEVMQDMRRNPVFQFETESGTESFELLVGTDAFVKERSAGMNPAQLELAQNFPNPFNPSTAISFTLNKSGNVRLSVFDLNGRRIADLVNGEKPAGYHAVNFNASGLSSGVYLYRLETATGVLVRKMALVK